LKDVAHDKSKNGSRESISGKRQNGSQKIWFLILFILRTVFLFDMIVFWRTNTYYDSILDNMDIMLFLDIVMFYFVDIKIFDY
jgi:hypothetical protein